MIPKRRYRTKGQITYEPLSRIAEHVDIDCSNTSWTTDATYPGHLTGTVHEMYDSVVPRFKIRSATGEVIMNPMTQMIKTSVSYGGHGCHYRVAATQPPSCPATNKWAQYREEGDWFPIYVNAYHVTGEETLSDPLPVRPLLTNLEVANTVTEATTKAWASRTLGDSNLFESVAEYRSTMDLFKDLFTKTNTTVSRWIRNPMVGASSVHLMIRYAIIPLVNDVKSIVAGLSKPIGPVRKTSRGRSALSRTKTETKVITTQNNILQITYQIVDNDEIVVRAMSLDEYVASLSANIGFDEANLLITPVELIPWSFVFDWFVNLSEYLKALAPVSDRKQLGSSYTTTRTISSLYTAVDTTSVNNAWELLRPCSGSVLSSRVLVNRVPLLPPPGLIVRNSFEKGDYVRTADALALLVQLLSRVASRWPTRVR